MIIIESGNRRVPACLWVRDAAQVESSAWDQIRSLQDLPYAFHHVAIMPDVHAGEGMPIGGILATKGVVVPNAVGVDIGCRMSAVSLGIDRLDVKAFIGALRECIPVGKNHHQERQPLACAASAPDIPVVQSLLEDLPYQVGTLGGGNHFIELQRSRSDELWVMVHSGSRNFGYRIANHYARLAEATAWTWDGLSTSSLAGFTTDSFNGKEYWEAMRFACVFAEENHRRMLDLIYATADRLGLGIKPGAELSVMHNYASREEHYGESVIVHRKGATFAGAGVTGIIPGSQGSRSYITRGRGCAESFCSSSHGAGRVLSRSRARTTLDLDAERQRLDEQGIIHSLRTVSDLDEAAGAYKDINTVMQQQTDLVDIVEELRPLGVLKG